MDYGIKSKQFFANENSSSMSEMNAKSEFEKNIQSYSQVGSSIWTSTLKFVQAQKTVILFFDHRTQLLHSQLPQRWQQLK